MNTTTIPAVKTSTLVLAVKAVDGDSEVGEFEAILSTPDVDRDGEVVKAGAFKPLPKSIPIYYGHSWRNGGMPVARAKPFYDGDVLKASGTFASTPAGQEMRALVAEGIVDSMSVGYIRLTTKGNETTKGELFEASFTGIPVHTGARVLAAKALADEAPGLAVKAIVGSYEERSEQLREALRTLHSTDPAVGYTYCWVRATFDDHVVYEVDAPDGTTTYSRTYTIDGTTITFGEPQQVNVSQVVTPAATAAPASTTVTLSADAPALDPTTPAATPSAPTPPDPAPSPDGDPAAATKAAAGSPTADTEDGPTLDSLRKDLLEHLANAPA